MIFIHFERERERERDCICACKSTHWDILSGVPVKCSSYRERLPGHLRWCGYDYSLIFLSYGKLFHRESDPMSKVFTPVPELSLLPLFWTQPLCLGLLWILSCLLSGLHKFLCTVSLSKCCSTRLASLTTPSSWCCIECAVVSQCTRELHLPLLSPTLSWCLCLKTGMRPHRPVMNLLSCLATGEGHYQGFSQRSSL